jgi:hypothetical protein
MRPILVLLGVVSLSYAAAPTQISAQSWLEYSGSVDAQYDFTCTVPEGAAPIPRATGPFAFYFGNGTITSQGGFGSGRIAADGSASGGSGPSFTWWGRFLRGSDGSIQGAGSISPEAGAIGCSGTWTAGAAAAPSTEPAVCAEYQERIRSLKDEIYGLIRSYSVIHGIEEARDQVQKTNREITNIKTGTLTGGNLEQLQARRREAYAQIKQLEAVVDHIRTLWLEVRRLRSEFVKAGCGDAPATAVRTAGSGIIDDLLNLETSPPPPSTIGVAGIRGIVDVEFGGAFHPRSKGPLRDGTPLPLDQPVTIRTGPGSAVTIQVGSVRKTVGPMTTIRIMPGSNGQPDFIEQGTATVDVQKPGANQIQTPAATANVDGTIFTVSHDPATGITGIMVYEGRVSVRPENSALRGVTLGPGEYVQVSLNAVSAVLPAPGAPATASPAANPQTNPPAGQSVSPQGRDLTGLWLDDSGGGAVHRVRQVGTRFYWSVDGTSRGSYNNIAFGDITGNTINLKWVDLPGSPTLGGGDLTLRIESNDRLVKISSTANYPPGVWTRQGSRPGTVTPSPAPPPAPAPAPAPAPTPAPAPPPAAPPVRPGQYLSVQVNGQTAILNWSNAPTTPGTWVSIVPAGTPDGTHTGRWRYTENQAAGTYQDGPLDPGAYEARFYADANYGQLVDRVRFNVGTDAALMLRTVVGQILRVVVNGRDGAVLTWTNAPTAARAWVSVVPVGTAVTAHVGKWTYTSQTAAGRYETGPLAVGEYEARFYEDEGYGRLIEQVRFRVQ